MTAMQAEPWAAPTWRRARFWVAIALIAFIGALLVAVLRPAPAIPLDPSSPAKSGSKALAVLLADRGVAVRRVTSLADASGSTVLVTDPDVYNVDQLRALSAERVILIAPASAALQALLPGVEIRLVQGADQGAVANCADPGSEAAGPVLFPSGTGLYAGPDACFDGRVLLGGRVDVIGSDALLRNDRLSDDGVAALDLNLLGANGAVTWLLPGADATGPASASVWQLLPGGARRATYWLLGVGLLAALWRGRRLAPVVSEPLPVIVRAAEVVEGHGRLYRRAAARDRAAEALRDGTRSRLAARLGLPSSTPAAEVAQQWSDPVRATAALAATPPVDDPALLALGAELVNIERGPTR